MIFESISDQINNMLEGGLNIIWGICFVVGIILMIMGGIGFFRRNRGGTRNIIFVVLGLILIMFSIRFGSVLKPEFFKGGNISF
ncbi:MAG: hypothetical protein ACTSWY_08775 [Promethearchaeota archaeon]